MYLHVLHSLYIQFYQH